ncbi:MAG TPA: hypothetical protein VK749_12035 [Xanthobacteraceae bacterium]|jgi:hypothetical protein|nr:hypothetical protein [Xanthobacteraceae bacterium]
MADTETEQLVVALEARIDAFEKNMAKAAQTANTNWSAIEARGRQAGNRIRADMGRATAGIANGFKALNGSIIGSLGLTGAASAAGFLTLAVKINGELAKMASLAKQAEISTDKLQEIKYAANINGVSDDDFATSLQQSLAMLEEAQHGVNDLKRLFNANGKSIRDSNGELIKFDKLLEIAADLISRAPTNEAKVKITEMMGLSRDWIRTLQGGPEAFRKMQQEAQSAGAVIDSATIAKAKEFDQAWAKAVVKFKAGITETLADLSVAFAEFWQNIIDDVPGASYIVEKMRRMFGGLEGMTIPELQDALQRSIEQGVDKVEIERIQAELDRKMGKKPLRIEIHPEVKGPPSVIPQEKQKNAFDSAVFETQKRIAATEAETASIGKNSEERTRAITVAELEEAAKRANTQAGFQNATVTDEQRDKINKLADAMEAAAQKQRLAEEQFKGFNELLQQSGQTAIDFIQKLGDKTANFRQMIQSVIQSMEKMALQAALLGQGPLAGIFGTATGVPGGTGGLLGALAGLFGGKRAEGGDVDPGKAFLVGERGPEIFAPKVAGGIIPNHRLALGGGSVGRVGHTFNSHVTVQGGAGNAEGNEDIARRVGASVREQFGSMMQDALYTQMKPGGTVWQMMQKGK